MSTVLVFAELIFVSPVAIVRPTLNKVVNKINNAIWRYQQMNCSNERLNNVKFNFNVGFFFVLPFVMELLSSLLRIVLGILSVNIKMFQMTFWWTRSFTKRFGTWDNTKPQKICLSLKMFIIDYWRFDLFPIFSEVSAFLFLCLASSVIRQNGEPQNGCFKKTKHVKFSEKRTFLNTWYARNCYISFLNVLGY